MITGFAGRRLGRVWAPTSAVRQALSPVRPRKNRRLALDSQHAVGSHRENRGAMLKTHFTGSFSGVVCLCLATLPSFAYDYVSSDGHRYKIECNRSGYVLQSTHPVSRFEEGGAISRVHDIPREKIYLGKDCDAFHQVFGGGKWCWANGGFVADFPKISFGFPRQELSCPNNAPYSLECGC